MLEKLKKAWQTIWNVLKPIVTFSNILSWKFNKDKNELEITTRISTILIVGFILGCFYMWYRYGPFVGESDLVGHNITAAPVVQIENNQQTAPELAKPLAEKQRPPRQKKRVSHHSKNKKRKRKNKRTRIPVSYSGAEYRILSTPYVSETFIPEPMLSDPFVPDPCFVECYTW